MENLSTPARMAKDIIAIQSAGKPLNPVIDNPVNALSGNRLVPNRNVIVNDAAELISLNPYPIPDAVTILVNSNSGAGADPFTRVSLLNQDYLNNIDDNGSGAGSILYTYQDGTKFGQLTSLNISQQRSNQGAPCFGFSIRLTDSAGAGQPSLLANCNPSFTTRNVYGRSNNLDVASTFGQGRSDFDTSIMVWRVAAGFSRFTQFEFEMPGDAATDFIAVVTLYFTRNFRG